MLSPTLIMWIVGGVLSALGTGMAVKLYLSYRYGRKTQEGIYKDAELKKANVEKNALGKLAEPDAVNDDALLDSLRGKNRD